MRKLQAQSRTLKKLPEKLDAIARNQGIARDDIEVWFTDEARIGQKNKITRRWARRGSRPAAPADQRTASTYIFGAICPGTGKSAGLILPWCNTDAMNLHLAAISAEIAPGKHAALLADQRDGTSRPASLYRPTSPWFPCRPSVRSLMGRKTSGSTFGTIRSPT
jgi:hypothetical protein